MDTANSSQLITVFDGALTIRGKPRPGRDFPFEATFILDHPSFRQFRSAKPPRHLHPYQEEYVQVLEGALVLEIEGREHVVRPEDGEFTIAPWTIHRLYTPPAEAGSGAATAGSNVVRFMASGEEAQEAFNMDLLFFENWYGYQNEAIRNRRSIDLIQAMCTFDAGGSYLTLPPYFPFRRILSRAAGVVIGRWLGELLGYRPFHREWSSDWSSAKAKMQQSEFYRKGGSE
ncbi:hypothetical protein PG994_006200 [Apiospora phragmitis]|uniref:Cupin type-2 domain-containing protein n=1 Tax=Apiospora phragmitis TaxID=2905665 RepID=A0ABR1VED7_9PEZI